ncbi:hypothetical protein NL676_029603 [Syzygium grande]|nr:hypothetical protein NL676_029603 [Syzygium grande]
MVSWNSLYLVTFYANGNYMGFEFGEERDNGLRQLQDLSGATLQSNFEHGNSFGIYIEVKLGGSKDYLNWKGVLRMYEKQFTGINALMFYALVLFQTVGFKNKASSSSSLITGILNVSSTSVSIYAVNRVGRRKLLLQACIQMFISCYWSNSISLFESRKLTRQKRGCDPGRACVLVRRAFAWPWGPLSWLIPSETFPIETRTAGFTFAVSSNMLFAFLIARAFLSMLCDMCSYIFFFTGWIFLMGLFVLFLLSETKEQRANGCDGRQGVEAAPSVWKKFMD